MLVKHSHRAYLQQKSPVTCMQAHHALSSQSCLSFLQSVAKDMQQCHLEVGCLPSVQRLRPCAVRILALSPINGASTTSLDNVGPCLTTPVIIKEKKKKGWGFFFLHFFLYLHGIYVFQFVAIGSCPFISPSATEKSLALLPPPSPCLPQLNKPSFLSLSF